MSIYVDTLTCCSFRKTLADDKTLSPECDQHIQASAAILLAVINCASLSFSHTLGGNPETLSARIANRQPGCPTEARFAGHDGDREYTCRPNQCYTTFNSPGGFAMSDTFNMSGDFRGAIVNIKATLRNVTQTVNTLPGADESAKAELTRLIEQLNEALQKAPAEDAEAVADSAKALVDAANKPKPNKATLQITADGLKKAAENIAVVAPAVVGIATQIVAAVFKLAR
jgi:hypothetical protein